MKEHRITIEIDQEGQIVADAEGFSGDLCLKDLTRLLEGLGAGRTTERKPDADRTEAAVRATVGKKR
ncbi:MAG: DUF2997 domain-containing protein [Polyangiaceae bacterium]